MRRLRALEAGREAQVDGMRDDGAGQQGIEYLVQGITTAAKGGIDVLAKGAQPLKGCCLHAVSMPKCALLVSPSSPTPCCRLNGKLRSWYEYLPEAGEAWIYLAMRRLMRKRLAREQVQPDFHSRAK